MKKFILIAASAILAVSAYAQTPKFAYVNFTELVQLMPAADSARAQLDAQGKAFEEAYQDMIEEFEAKSQQYQQKASTWTASIREAKERELNDFQTRIQAFGQNAQQELAQSQNQLMAPIQQRAMDVVNKLAKDGGYAMVFDQSQFIYANDAQVTNLTAAARKQLGIPDSRTMESLQAELQARAQQQ